MTTEIRFLLNLVLEHKLPAEAKKLCLERIGEVEASLQGPRQVAAFVQPPRLAGIEQAPSTQRLLEGGGGTLQPQAAPIAPPVAARIVGGEVNTGNGTKGPRKF